MKPFTFEKKYSAFTLLELLIVMSIITTLLTMSLSSFGGLRNTIRMNEYLLNLEQDIRGVQRAAMLLEKDPKENWIYGLGIDFTKIGDGEGEYKMFKWCSRFSDYGDITTRSTLPNFIPPEHPSFVPLNLDGNGSLPISSAVEGDFPSGLCETELEGNPNTLYSLSGYAKPMSPPASVVTFPEGDARYVLFESVSGRTFFYDKDGKLLNYDSDGNPRSAVDIVHLTIQFKPLTGTGKPRRITIANLSGKIEIYTPND